MSRKKIVMLFLLTIMLLVTACGPGEKKSKTGDTGNENVAFPVKTSNDGQAVKDAVLKVAIVKDSPLVGLLSDVVYSDGYDGILVDNFLGSGIFETDENFEVTDGGIATLTVDAANKKATIKILINNKAIEHAKAYGENFASKSKIRLRKEACKIKGFA